MGSLMMRSTSRPAIWPASLVAVRWASSKYAGHGDHGLGDRVAEVGLGVALQLHQRAGADLLRRVRLAVDVGVFQLVAHVALHRPDRAVGVGDGLALGDLADEDLAGLGEGDHRRGGARPSLLGMTTGSPASRTATTELVVPRSMPTALGMADGSSWDGLGSDSSVLRVYGSAQRARGNAARNNLESI